MGNDTLHPGDCIARSSASVARWETAVLGPTTIYCLSFYLSPNLILFPSSTSRTGGKSAMISLPADAHGSMAPVRFAKGSKIKLEPQVPSSS
jgi:hypothetical protein